MDVITHPCKKGPLLGAKRYQTQGWLIWEWNLLRCEPKCKKTIVEKMYWSALPRVSSFLVWRQYVKEQSLIVIIWPNQAHH